jgi:drug/metabolite transporter (DMT)-like permease
MTDASSTSGRPAEQRGLGILLRVGAVTFFGAMMAALKYASQHGVTAAELVFYRNLFAFPTIVAWVLFAGGVAVIKTKRPGAHAIRSAIGLAVMFGTFMALSMLPLAEATVISFSAPLFATMLSALVLGEKVLWHRWGAITLGFIGVLIVAQPNSSSLPPLGVIIGLCAALGTAVVVITLRQIGETENPAATVFWFNIVCIVATALPMPLLFRNHTPDVWGALVVGGLLGGVAQIMMTAALRYAPVSVLAPFDYLQIVWATFWGFVLFATLPTAKVVAGAVLIAGAGLYVVWRERKLRKTIVPSSNEL